MSGDNIMSRINTNFDYDATGRPVRQSEGGYNIEPAYFAVHWVHSKAESHAPISGLPNSGYIAAYFAKEDIPAGTELRVSYNYSEKAMADRFPKKPA
jgi:hypothetical protein